MVIRATTDSACGSLSASVFLSFLILFMCPMIALGQVVWQNYPDIQAGQVAIYTGTALIVDLTTPVTFNRTYSLSSGTSPVVGTIGITAFQIPETHDFALITNKTLGASIFSVDIQVSDQSAFYVLNLNYMVMFGNSPIYRLLYKQYYCQTINKGSGYRSEYDIISPSTADGFFTTPNIESTLVLEGFRLINTQGTYTFLGVTVNIPTAGKINTTFFTYEENAVYFIQYSIIFYKRTAAQQDMVELFDIGYANFTFNNTLVGIFFNSIDTRYTGASGRMFFGLREFNFTYLNNKKFQLNTNNYNNLWTGYTFTADTLVRIRLSYLFFVKRTCNASTFYYPDPSSSLLDNCFASCGTFSDRPVANATSALCMPCHYSCLTCSSASLTTCLTCSPNQYRTIIGSSCPCLSGYLDNGAAVCIECSSAIVGCLTCTSSTACTSCMAGFTGTTSCSCSGHVVSGFCTSVYGCTSISDITGTPLCTSCNETLFLQLSAAFQCVCINGTTTLANSSCVMKCGDGYVLPQEGCDDGNTVSGDGCSSTCKVQKNWACVGSGSTGSTCKISVVPNLEYIGVYRLTGENTAILYFTLKPYFPQYSSINYTGLLDSNLINYGFDVEYKTSQQLLVATIHYKEDIQGAYQTFILYLNSTKYFWNSSDWATFHLKGVNCELTYDTALWVHNVLKWVFVGLVVLAACVFGASLFFEKWIGLELIQTFQGVFFSFAMLQQCPFEFTGMIEALRYSNGFDDLLVSGYAKTYTLSNPLIMLSVEKEFIFNFNLLYIILLGLIVAMIVLGALQRRYRRQLQQQISKKITDKLKKVERAYTALFGRVFLMMVFFCMFKIVFSFCVQLSSESVPVENFPDQLNVIAGIIAFVLIFSMISFVLYWFLLLPPNFSEEEQFMSLRFQNMSFYYPVFYLAYQAFFILMISISYLQTFTQYAVIGFQTLYFLALIYLRPYNTLRKFNKLFHNATIILNQAIVIAAVGIVIRWNQLIGTPGQSGSNYELTVYCFLILFFLSLAVTMAILRLVMFNKEVSFRCLKKDDIDVEEIEEADLGHMKRMITQDKDKIMRAHTPNSSFLKDADKETTPLRRKPKNDNIDVSYLIEESKIDAFLQHNENNIVKERRDDGPVQRKKSKIRSSIARKAELPKTALESYIEMRNMQRKVDNQNQQF